MNLVRSARGCFVLLGILTFATRFYFLENKPIHFDEGINAWFVLQMQAKGFFEYNPLNFHGPLYFYLLKMWTEIWGHSIASLRTLPTLISAFTVLFFHRRLPWMSWLLLLSPSLIFYGRSGIHESAFVFSQILFFWGLWSFHRRQRLISLWGVGLGILGMISLKETFTITGFCALIAMLISGYPWRALYRSLPAMKYPILFFIFAWALLFSGFGHNPAGLRDFFMAFAPWLKTGAAGSGHEKAFDYWLQLAGQAEPLLLVGVIAALGGLFSSWRMVAAFALLQGLIYSWIPYKTPWCFITLAWPFYFCLALALSYAWNRPEKFIRPLISLLLFFFAFVHGKQIWISAYRNEIDLNHPFVYVNSTYAFKELNRRIMHDLEQNSVRRDEIIQISVLETWPLPWTLHNSHGLRYDTLRKKFISGAWIYFCDASDDEFLQTQLGDSVKNYRHASVQMRQSTPPISVWWRVDTSPP